MSSVPQGPVPVGPRPSSPADDPLTGMSTARAGVLASLGELGGPCTVLALAERSGQHPNTVREHLDALVEFGLVTREAEPTGARGRPALRYRPVPAEQSRPQLRVYAALAAALARRLEVISADPGAEARETGRLWGAELVDDVLRSPADHVLAAFTALGFDPHPVEDVVELRACPLLEVARRHPQVVCNVHLGLVEGVYLAVDADPSGAELEPFARPGCCVLRLPPDRPDHPDHPDRSDRPDRPD